MEYSESFDQGWIHKTNLRKDLIDEFIDAFLGFTDGLEFPSSADLDRAISAARAQAIAKYQQRNQEDGQS